MQAALLLTRDDVQTELDRVNAAVEYITDELRAVPMDRETRAERLAERRRLAEQRDGLLARLIDPSLLS